MSDPPASMVDNRPGTLTCPSWLLELDDPAPERVIIAGAPAPAMQAWFADRGATVDLLDRNPSSLPPPAPLLVLDARRSGRGGRRLQDPSWLLDTGAIVFARAPDAAWTRALRGAGLDHIRPVRSSSGQRWSASRPHLALRRPRPGAGPGARAVIPSWLDQLAGATGPSVQTVGWSLRVPGDYPSQKAVAVVETGPVDGGDVIVKITRHPRFNHRLMNEATMLDAVHRGGGPVAHRAPEHLALTHVAGLIAVAQRAIPGGPFLSRASLRVGCPLANDAAEAIAELGAATVDDVPPTSLSARLDDLLERFVHEQGPSPAVAAFLRDQVDLLAAQPPPGVLFHGDLGTWNLWVDDLDHVWVLDWESGELGGPPLWDLLYFIRSLAVRSGRRRGLTRRQAINRHLLGESPLTARAAWWIEQYCSRVGIDQELVEPLLHTCWMHRAVKERARLAPDEPGHYGPLCIRMVEARSAPGLRRLVGA